MILQQTNIPGYKKNKETNTIVPDNLDNRVAQVKIVRQRYKENQQLIRDVADIKERLERLEGLIR